MYKVQLSGAPNVHKMSELISSEEMKEVLFFLVSDFLIQPVCMLCS